MASGRELPGPIRNLSYKGFSLGLERACRLFVVVASARMLGQTAFGRFVFAWTVTSLLALGTDLGLGVWTTRGLARRRGDGADIVRVGLGLRALASIPYALAVAGAALWSGQGETRAAMALLGVGALLGAFGDHFGAILRGADRFADEARLNTARALLTTALGLGGLMLGNSLAGLCAGLAAAGLVAFGYGTVAVLRLHPLQASFAVRAADRALARNALEQSLPIWFAGLLSILYFKVDTLFLRSFAGDGELGAYGAAYKFFEGSMIVPSVVLSVTFPALARLGDNPAARLALERRIAAGLIALGGLAGAVFLLCGDTLVRWFFGPAFDRSASSLRVLALGLPLVFVNYGLTHFLLARDRGRTTLGLAFMMLVLTVALDVALIPGRAGPGAAWATVLAEVALTLGCLGALRTRVRPANGMPSAPAAAKTDPRAA
jgi:O-antigen/teichoic acid export membrane protein